MVETPTNLDTFLGRLPYKQGRGMKARTLSPPAHLSCNCGWVFSGVLWVRSTVFWGNYSCRILLSISSLIHANFVHGLPVGSPWFRDTQGDLDRKNEMQVAHEAATKRPRSGPSREAGCANSRMEPISSLDLVTCPAELWRETNRGQWQNNKVFLH